jgi:hypothetical protein
MREWCDQAGLLHRTAPGGYDFYWQLKDAAHALTVGGGTFEDCAKPIEKGTREVERKHNLDCLNAARLD